MKALGVFLGMALLAAPAQEAKTNVVIILADDLGFGDLGCFGHPRFKTPHLDRLAAEGTRLTSFYTPMAFCAPTRASLMTGRYPVRCGLYQNPFPKGDPQVKNGDDLGLPVEERTLGDALRAGGYATAHIGKWHLGHQPRFRPVRRGFDEFYGLLYSNDMHPVELFDGDARVEYPVVQTTLLRRLTERSVAFLEKQRGKPFFLYFAPAVPHKPMAPGEEFYGKSGAGLYGDTIAELDWSVGRLLAKLQELGLDRRTLVVFTSDNGPWYGGSAGAFRGMKGRTWEGGIRVPFIARGPGIPAGRTSDEPAAMMDLFPTALAAAGVAIPADRPLDGKNLLPLLQGEAKSPHEALFSFRANKPATVRCGKWKLHVALPGPAEEKVWKADEAWVDPRRPDGVRILAPFEQGHPSQFPGVLTGTPAKALMLFDLEADPGEQKDLAADHPDVVARLKQLAADFK